VSSHVAAVGGHVEPYVAGHDAYVANVGPSVVSHVIHVGIGPSVVSQVMDDVVPVVGIVVSGVVALLGVRGTVVVSVVVSVVIVVVVVGGAAVLVSTVVEGDVASVVVILGMSVVIICRFLL